MKIINRKTLKRKILKWKKILPSKKVTTAFRKRPLLSFLGILLVLFLLIAASNFLLNPKPAELQTEELAKEVKIYTIGQAPKLTLSAQVEKSNVVKITALNPGVVQAINFSEGDYVLKGQTVAVLSTNYQGGNAPVISRQLAESQLNNINSTYPLQKELINKQRELANKGDQNADELRNITSQSISETQAVANLNESIISSINEDIKGLEDTDPNNPQINQFKQLKSQFSAANLQLKNQLRNAEFSASETNPPSQLSDLQKDITLKQLELQEKGLELSKESARLQLILAQINEATMYPGAPFSGTVERIHIKVGQQVTPGTPIITLKGDNTSSNVYAKVSKEIANSISTYEPSTLSLGSESLSIYPDFVSTEATDGSLHIVHFYIPSEYSSKLADKEYVQIQIPIGMPDTGAALPFVPVDSVFQSQEKDYLFVLEKDRAKVKEIKLGEVFGNFVEVTSGLTSGDQIILDRFVIANEKVKRG